MDKSRAEQEWKRDSSDKTCAKKETWVETEVKYPDGDKAQR